MNPPLFSLFLIICFITYHIPLIYGIIYYALLAQYYSYLFKTFNGCQYQCTMFIRRLIQHTVTYKTVDMFSTCVVFDEYLTIEKSSPNETGCVGKGCFSAFEQDINHAIILFFDGDID